jgi:hypothetical protein
MPLGPKCRQIIVPFWIVQEKKWNQKFQSPLKSAHPGAVPKSVFLKKPKIGYEWLLRQHLTLSNIIGITSVIPLLLNMRLLHFIMFAQPLF